MKNMAKIQFQDRTGNWVTSSVTSNNPQMVANRLISLQKARNGARVRAIDATTGVIIDIR